MGDDDYNALSGCDIVLEFAGVLVGGEVDSQTALVSAHDHDFVDEQLDEEPQSCQSSGSTPDNRVPHPYAPGNAVANQVQRGFAQDLVDHPGKPKPERRGALLRVGWFPSEEENGRKASNRKSERKRFADCFDEREIYPDKCSEAGEAGRQRAEHGSDSLFAAAGKEDGVVKAHTQNHEAGQQVEEGNGLLSPSEAGEYAQDGQEGGNQENPRAFSADGYKQNHGGEEDDGEEFFNALRGLPEPFKEELAGGVEVYAVWVCFARGGGWDECGHLGWRGCGEQVRGNRSGEFLGIPRERARAFRDGESGGLLPVVLLFGDEFVNEVFAGFSAGKRGNEKGESGDIWGKIELFFLLEGAFEIGGFDKEYSAVSGWIGGDLL